MGVVHLAFDATLGPVGLLIFRMEVNSRIGTGESHQVHPEIEVFEGVAVYVTNVKQVRGR